MMILKQWKSIRGSSLLSSTQTTHLKARPVGTKILSINQWAPKFSRLKLIACTTTNNRAIRAHVLNPPTVNSHKHTNWLHCWQTLPIAVTEATFRPPSIGCSSLLLSTSSLSPLLFSSSPASSGAASYSSRCLLRTIFASDRKIAKHNKPESAIIAVAVKNQQSKNWKGHFRTRELIAYKCYNFVYLTDEPTN